MDIERGTKISFGAQPCWINEPHDELRLADDPSADPFRRPRHFKTMATATGRGLEATGRGLEATGRGLAATGRGLEATGRGLEAQNRRYGEAIDRGMRVGK